MFDHSCQIPEEKLSFPLKYLKVFDAYKTWTTVIQSTMSGATMQGRHEKWSLYTGGRTSHVDLLIHLTGGNLSGRCRQVGVNTSFIVHLWNEMNLYY